MGLQHASDRQSFFKMMETLSQGDCLEVDSFSAVAEGSAELLDAIGRIAECGADFASLQEGVDTRSEAGASFFALCRALGALDQDKPRPRRRDGIERAKEEGRYKGRRPIAVDENLFDSVVSLWQSGEITAREAMANHGKAGSETQYLLPPHQRTGGTENERL